MRTVKQIKENIKQSGLTGRAYRVEFQQQLLKFGKELALDLITGTGDRDNNWQEALVSLAHISEIFRTAEREGFAADFIEDFQTEIFHISSFCTETFLEWRKDIFGEPEVSNG